MVNNKVTLRNHKTLNKSFFIAFQVLNSLSFLFFILIVLIGIIYKNFNLNKEYFNLIKNEPNSKWRNYIENFYNQSLVYKDFDFKNNKSSRKCFTNQINLDFNYWKNFNLNRKLLQTTKIDAIHYQIINNKLYRQKNCLFMPRCQGVEHYLLKTLKTTKIKNLDLLINVHDWPKIYKYQKIEKFPIFSFSKDYETYADIIYPAWSFWSGGPSIESHPTGIGKWNELKSKIIKHASKFELKKNVTFFRGSRTTNERDAFILFSKKYPYLVDAKYTKNQAWKSIQDTLGELPANEVKFEDHCKFKYLLNMRGVAASFRYRHLFACRSLVLNVESNWIEFFYDALLPWYHFVPIQQNAKDLKDVLFFLKKYQNLSQQIAENGFQFILNFLTEDSVQCYWNNLLFEYQKLIDYQIEKENDFILIG